MDGLLRNCATGCRVDDVFTMDDLVDSISADTSGLRCGHVQLRIVFITPTSDHPPEPRMKSWVPAEQDQQSHPGALQLAMCERGVWLEEMASSGKPTQSPSDQPIGRVPLHQRFLIYDSLESIISLIPM
ncbi:hypothetical protein DPX16_23599 [Anabarilius grahami]|uniref:Uncharacterized protein n=1 Tax=Anabarilius grahami TaxID=495550 RepID=A0A3N0XPH2_ANAGA|nr:hypothetical protein DPX16_23599 [Anabarilius grahami]